MKRAYCLAIFALALIGTSGLSLAQVDNQAGWPKTLAGPVSAETIVADLGGASVLFVASGGERSLVYGWGGDGVLLPGWPVEAAAGRGGLAAADLDGDGLPEIILADAAAARLAVYGADGRLLWTRPIEREAFGRPVTADLDGDGSPEIVLALTSGRVHVFEADGGERPGWPRDVGGLADPRESLVPPIPAVGEFDGVGTNGLEIAVGASLGGLWLFHGDGAPLADAPFGPEGPVVAAPILGDLDGDGAAEVVWADTKGRVNCREAAGDDCEGFPLRLNAAVFASPLALDAAKNGCLDILIGDYAGLVHRFDCRGQEAAGWPQRTAAGIVSSLVAGDVDGDSEADIVALDESGRLYVWRLDGFPVCGYPLALGGGARATPVLADLDGDRDTEIIVGDLSGVLHVFDDGRVSATLLQYALPWGGVLGSGASPRSTGRVTASFTEPVADAAPADGTEDYAAPAAGCAIAVAGGRAADSLWVLLVLAAFVLLRLAAGRKDEDK